MDEVIQIPVNPTLYQLRELLADVTNRISSKTEVIAGYKTDLTNSKNAYKRELAAAKVRAIARRDLKPSNQTMINAYAVSDPLVISAEQVWEVANATHELGITELEALKETALSLKKMIGSIETEMRANVYGG